MLTMCGPVTVDGRQIWLSDLQRDLLMKMSPTGAAAHDRNGTLVLECADGSSRPCGFNPQGVRREIVDLEQRGLLIYDADRQWSLTDLGRMIRAALTT